MNLNPIQRDAIRAYGGRTRGSQEAGASPDAGATSAAGAEESAASPRPDGVVLSDAAAAAGRAASAARSSPDVRESVVNALRARIQSGQYNVSAEDIVGAMIRSRD